MPNTLKFTKMHGLGNDFMVIDGIRQSVRLEPATIRRWSDRHFGIGFDQLLLVESPIDPEVDFKYRIFNADGSEVSQCGNGARCFAVFVREQGLTDKQEIQVQTNSGRMVLLVGQQHQVTVNMGVPRLTPAQIPFLAEQQSTRYALQVDQQTFDIGAVSMGNPHAVLQVADVSCAPVDTLGQQIECHPRFPERVNVGFMQILDREHIALRVYERGAAETLACGSGACAAVVVGILQGQLADSVTVRLPGGELEIGWRGDQHPVMMTGPASTVFEGTIII